MAEKNLRILILEDNSADAELIEYELGKGGISYEARVVDKKQAYIDALNNFKPDLVLADYHLPQFDGLSALKLARKNSPTIPYIFVSGAIGEEIAIETLKRGATDYVLKDHLSRLAPAVKRALKESAESLKRREAEEKLKLLEAGFNNAVDGFVITNASGDIQYVNQAFTTITGYTSAEAVGQNIRILRSGRHAASFFEEIQGTLKSGKSWIGEIINQKKDGSTYIDKTTISPIIDQSGKPANFICILRNVSKEKELEEQLLQAVKMESIGKLAGGIAHDFNNLLTIINGYSESLMRQYNQKKLREDLGQILRAGERAALLVEKILTFSREQHASPVVINLNETIKDLEKMIRRIVGEDIQIDVKLSPDAHALRIDPSQLEQIIMNIIVNSREAMPGGGKIAVCTKNSALDAKIVETQPKAIMGDYVQLSITDTGLGIKEEILERIFDPFFSTKERGTGLGLSSVYGIVKQNNGYLHVQSEAGRGTTFKIFFPGIIQHQQSNHVQIKQVPGNFQDKTVLVVEDEHNVLQLTKKMFESAGFQVIIAQNGEDALNKIVDSSMSIDLLFTDIIMTGMTGIETADRIHSIHPDIKVIFASGYPRDHLKRPTEKGEVIHFIKKPFSRRELLQKVKEVLN